MRPVVGVVVCGIFVSTVLEQGHGRIIIVVCEMAWDTFVKYAYFCGVWLSALLRRLRTVAESDYQLRHVCPHGTPRLPLDGFS